MGHALYTSGEYLKSNPTWHSEDAEWKASQVLRILAEQKLAPKSICDVGCGTGDALAHISDAFPAAICVGYDVSPQAIALAKKRERENLTYKVRASPDAEFELAIALDVLEHVEDYIGFVRTLGAAASHVALHIPLDISVQTVVRASPFNAVRQSVGHLHYFTKETALATLEHAGLQIERWFYTSGHEHALGGGRSAFKTRLAILPRSLTYGLSRDLSVRLFGGYSLMALCSRATQ